MGQRRVTERHLSLAGEPASAGVARRALRELLTETGHPGWRDAAELAVTEVVTNAVLHARCALAVDICVQPDQVRVEVRDTSPQLPVARSYDLEATTGRGLAIVAGVASDYGVEPLGPSGKIVWFCVGDDGPATRSAP